MVRQYPFIRWVNALGIPLPQSALNAQGISLWQELTGKTEQEWLALPGVGAERVRQIQRWLSLPEVTSLADWLEKQKVRGFTVGSE